MGRERRALRLRSMLTVAFTALTVLPVLSLAVWVWSNALDRAVAEVRERHLLIAQNLGQALTRYATDAEAVFEVFYRSDVDPAVAGESGLLQSLHFQHICVLRLTPGGAVVEKTFRVPDVPTISAFPLPELLPQVPSEPGTVAFSGVTADASGSPALYLLARVDAERIAVGALATDYFVHLQRAIRFGKGGHAVIVDQHGRSLAHPDEAWQLQRRDLSALAPVRGMMMGETGVAEFFSPALKARMIAGFTTEPRTGWGVMVPQPFAELEEEAATVRGIAVAIMLGGIVIAALLGWVLARFITRPVEAVADAAGRFAAGEVPQRTDMLPGLVPEEMHRLAEAFDGMAQKVQAALADQTDALTEAEAASRAKTRFVANMSHELRTPLHSIIGFSEILREERLGPVGNPQYLEHATYIRDAGRHLLAVINDILTLAQAEEGKGLLHDGPVDVPATVDACLAMVRLRAEEGGLRLENAVPADLPALQADEGKLRQILLNMLSNAVKFTPEGGVVTVAASADRGGMTLTVRDSGIGIAAEDMATALSPFGQVDNRLNREFDGTGLGLPLTRRLMELHEGRMRLHSRVGEGTLVTLHFPPHRVLGG
ncbi:MAG: ATP-binding protein [Alphaproteobacteria bacterium]